jgi:hypothetical protein
MVSLRLFPEPSRPMTLPLPNIGCDTRTPTENPSAAGKSDGSGAAAGCERRAAARAADDPYETSPHPEAAETRNGGSKNEAAAAPLSVRSSAGISAMNRDGGFDCGIPC